MGLIHKKHHICHGIAKKTLQIDHRVKYIIIITYDHIAPESNIELKFKRTYLIPPGIVKNACSVDLIFMMDHIENGLIHPVKMPSGPLTGIRLAQALFQRTYLLLGCQRNKFHPQSFFLQELSRVLRHRPCDCLGSQIKNPPAVSLSHGFNRRKEGSQGLTRSRRRLNKDIFSLVNRTVDTVHHPFLTEAIFIGKCQCFDGLIPQLLPLNLPFCPTGILVYQFLKPAFQFLSGPQKFKGLDHFRLQMNISNPNIDLF